MATAPTPSHRNLKPIPSTADEVRNLGWNGLDVILITGDALVDAPQVGVAVIGRVLLDAGYRVGVIGQPDVASERDIARLGEPALFWGVSGGCIDSMVANYTALGKRRKSDDMTAGGRNSRRPDRAVIAYANLVRKYFKATRPIVLGGVEASLRRVSHYDAWSDRIRRSVLFDAKADFLLYGMAEETILKFAEAISMGRSVETLRGLCYIARDKPVPFEGFQCPDVELPDHETASRDPSAFTRMFRAFDENSDPVTARRLFQRQDSRYLVHNPPAMPISSERLDRVHELPFTRESHPVHDPDGVVPALETIRFSLCSHRGCYGGCRFCAIAVHQGRQVVSRSEASVVREAAAFAIHPKFRGVISDVGGPTANMYGFECAIKKEKGACRDRNCLYPEVCRHLPVNHRRQIRLLESLGRLPGVKKVFIGSGIRYDLILKDDREGEAYLETILSRHVSGQLKIAPEHAVDEVLGLMGKPGREALESFLRRFRQTRLRLKKDVFLTYYLMAAHPGCTMAHMLELRNFAQRHLKLLPEQVQIFTPTPSTWSTLMYAVRIDPFSGKPLFVEKDTRKKALQKGAIMGRKEAGGGARPAFGRGHNHRKAPI